MHRVPHYSTNPPLGAPSTDALVQVSYPMPVSTDPASVEQRLTATLLGGRTSQGRWRRHAGYFLSSNTTYAT